MNKIRVSVVGASGYTGFELVRILLKHPDVVITNLAVRSDVGRPYSELFPALKGRCDLICSTIDVPKITDESDVIFFGLPHKTSMDIIPKFLDSGRKIIDLSADYRLNNEETYKYAYGIDHTDKGHLSEFVYGLPEFNRAKIRQTNTVANPGCFPTGIELALMPVLQTRWINTDSIIVDSKTGISGGGKTLKPAFHFPECNENMAAYKVASHQHEPEIEQELSKMAGKPVDIVFVPHLVPMTRGIYSTIYTELTGPVAIAELQDLYQKQYQNEPFVRVMDTGKIPEINHVTNTNFCDIGLVTSGSRLILISAIDNLIKGASGQAVQNMNVMMGLDETLGLN